MNRTPTLALGFVGSVGVFALGATLTGALVLGCGSAAEDGAANLSGTAEGAPNGAPVAPNRGSVDQESPSAAGDRGAASPAPTAPTPSEASPTGMPPKDGASNSPPPVAPEKPLRFLAVGDTGKGNDGQRAVAKAMAETCRLRGCDFVVLLGDNFYESGASSPTDPIFKERFEDVYVGMPMPFWAVLGNHDYGARGLGSEFSKPDNQIAYASTSSRFKMPARYFHFVAGPVEFFALDTNAQMYKRDGQQKADVAAWIAASTAPWKISLGHHPYLSNGSHGNAGKYEDKSWLPVLSGGGVKSFAEQVVCGKVDIALSGHDHNQQWLEDTCDGTELIVSGAGAEGKEIASQRNAARYQSGELGFLYAEVTSKQFVAEFVNVNLQTEYGRVLTKR